MKTKQVKQTATSRLTVLAILTAIVFVILRVANIIDWQWVWVLGPLWIGFGIAIIIPLIIGLIEDIRRWNEINRIK